MNKRIKKKKKTQETKLLRKICKDIKRICNNYTFHYSSVPDSEKFSDLIDAFEKIKSGAETLEKHYTTSSDIKNIYDPSISVTLPESDLKVEIVKDRYNRKGRYNRYVSWKGIPPHLRLAALYNAAYPTQKKMTDDEAATYLHNCMGEVRCIKGKKLYIKNIFADDIDSTQYNIHHGHLMMQQVLSDLRERLYENWEKGIPVDGFPDVDVSIPEDVMEELKKEAKTAINNILGLSKEDFMNDIKDYKIIYEGEALPKRINAPYVEIENKDFSIFGINEYTYYETFGQVLRNLSDDKIYRMDDICTFTNLKVFINVHSYKTERNMICLTKNFIETPIEKINDSKTMNVSIFFKVSSAGYPDILLIVKEVNLG